MSMKLVTRFYRDRFYVGVKESTKDCCGNWTDRREVVTFTGKPYNQFEFDAIYEFTGPKQLEHLLPDTAWRSVQRVVPEPLADILGRGEHAISCSSALWE